MTLFWAKAVAFFWAHSKWFALGGIVLAALALGKCHLDGDAKVKRDLAGARAEVQRLQSDLKQCRTNEATLEASIASQNAAVDRLKADGDARAAAATKAAQDALQARSKADAFARKLADYKSADTCPAREAGIAELVQGLKR